MTAVTPDLDSPGTDAGAGAADRRRRISVPAGLVDSALSSLSSFLIGIFATRELSAEALGTYALCYSAFMLACTVPVSLLFTPVEVEMLVLDRPARVRVFSRSLRLGVPLNAVVGFAICDATLLVPSGTPFSDRGALALTAAALTVVSPLQDHVRRVLHAAGRSWAAAGLSATVAVVTLPLLLGLRASPLPEAWVPFTSLAGGNVVSLLLGLAVLRILGDRRPHGLDLGVRALLGSGRWLLLGAGWSFLSGFIAVALLTAVAGAAAAGYAEAARVLSQPVTVLAIGLMSVFNPELMAAARTRERGHLYRTLRNFFVLVGLGAAGWLVVTAVRWPGNPLPRFFPVAYHESGLLSLLLVEQALGYAAIAYGNALLGGGRARYSAGVSVLSGVFVIIVVAATAWTGAYAMGYAGLAGAVVLHTGGILGLRRMFEHGAADDAGAALEEAAVVE